MCPRVVHTHEAANTICHANESGSRLMKPWWEVLRGCTLVGSLNPAILRPEWLARQGVIPDSQADMRFTVDPRVVKTVFETSLYIWSVDDRRLIVNSASGDADPGEFVATVMEKLEHTPVEAVGNNFYFDSSHDVGAQVWAQRYSIDLPGKMTEALLGHELIHRFEHDGAIVGLKHIVKGGAIRATQFNFNRPVASPSEAANAARKWLSDREIAESLMSDLFGEKNAPN